MKILPRELEAGKLVAAGLSVEQIMEKMNCGRKSVQGYISRVRKKTNSPTNRALTLFLKKETI